MVSSFYRPYTRGKWSHSACRSWAVVVGVNRNSRKSMISTSSRCEGPTKAVTWDISNDGGVVPMWEREDGGTFESTMALPVLMRPRDVSEQFPLEATMQVSSSKTGTLVLVFDFNSFSSLQDRPYHRSVRQLNSVPPSSSADFYSHSASYSNLYDVILPLSLVYPTNYAAMYPSQIMQPTLCQLSLPEACRPRGPVLGFTFQVKFKARDGSR